MKLNFLKNKETKNALWLIGGRVAQMALSLFVGILSARYLGPANYGLINYASALVSFFMSICTLGINSIIIKDFFDHPDEEGTAVGTAITLRLLSSICSAILSVSISLFLDYGEWETVVVVALCAISLLFHVLDTLKCWFQYKYLSRVTAIAIFLAYVATSAYKIILLVLKKSVFWFAFATSVDYIVLGVLLLLFYKKHGGPKLSFSWSKGKSLLKNSYHYILSGLMVSLYNKTDKLMLKHMMDDETVGYYSTAFALCSMWTFVLSAIIDAMYPTIIKSFEKSPQEFEKKNRQLYAIVFYISTFVSLMFVIFGRLGIRILYGAAYLPAALPLSVITWYTAFSYFGVARNAWMVCNHKQKYIKYMYIPAVIINIALNALLIPIWGAVGAAVASLVTQIATSMVLPALIKDLRPNAKLMLDAILLRDVLPKKTDGSAQS